jgi:beta-galactosidase
MSQPDYLNQRFPQIWHGGDYNPEQWPQSIWEEDMALMQKAHLHVATIGVFSWARLEPAEGQFDFTWLDHVIELLTEADQYFILATPSAAAPAWMTAKYPEIIRTGSDRVRRQPGNRVNYNYSSPIYREKCQAMARELALRYGAHPRLLAWHVSNEYGGEDYSPQSIAGFRRWLQTKYGTLDALNAAYWTPFWSHTYSDWDQIDAPGQPYAETAVQGLTVDWQRFVTDATLELMQIEMAPLREISPSVPITTNFMGTYPGLNYRKFAPLLDFASWDSYPAFGGPLQETDTWINVAFKHDLTRGLNANGRWMMMECSPSSSNWYPTMQLKRPGMHRFEAMQAVAHGADGVQYFQWRQSRGSQEQLHGAVVNHGTTDNGRVFRDVQQTGQDLEALSALAGSRPTAKIAIIYDWEACWALDAACGPLQGNKGYESTAIDHYRPFWESGINVDVVGPEADLTNYSLVILPMAYAMAHEQSVRLQEYVRAGGTLVTTYLTAWTDENSLIFPEGFLSPLRNLLGIWSEELDVLDARTQNSVRLQGLDLDQSYPVATFAELIHLTTAKAIGHYESDFYAGQPAITVNQFGEGTAYYVAARLDRRFMQDFLLKLAATVGITPAIQSLPPGVTVQTRQSDGTEWSIFLNASPVPQTVSTDQWGPIALPAWGTEVRLKH